MDALQTLLTLFPMLPPSHPPNRLKDVKQFKREGSGSYTLNDVRMTANSALVTGRVKRSLVFWMLFTTSRKKGKRSINE